LVWKQTIWQPCSARKGNRIGRMLAQMLCNHDVTALPDFSRYNTRGKIYQITIKYTKWPQNTYTKWPQNRPNGCKIDQMAVKWIKWTINIPSSSIVSPSKICPNYYFWFENIPSGNPAL
jgi:hypothetical protein